MPGAFVELAREPGHEDGAGTCGEVLYFISI